MFLHGASMIRLRGKLYIIAVVMSALIFQYFSQNHKFSTFIIVIIILIILSIKTKPCSLPTAKSLHIEVGVLHQWFAIEQ